MSDSFREVTSVSWFGRIGRSIGGVLFGIVLILAMVIGLFWNEGRAVTTARSLAEGAGIVQSVSAEAVDPALEGMLVHVTGPVAATAEPRDTTFGVVAAGIRLERQVEMYQWAEHRKSETRTKLGGGEETVTTYTYEKEWSGSANNSGDFKVSDGHSNPGMNYRSESFQIPEATLGAFRLDEAVLGRIGGDETLALDNSMIETVKAGYSGPRAIHVTASGAYVGFDPSSPRVGDYRIGWQIVPLAPISVIGRQTQNGFAPYQTEAGDRLLMVDLGSVAARQMFDEAVTGNKVLTWVLRAVGLILLAVGFALIMGPIGVVADVVPFLGNLVRMGTGAIAVVLAVLVGGVTIAVAWFWYRPLLAVAIILASFAIAWLVSRLGRSRASSPEVVGA